VGSLLLTLVATIYPAWRASQIQPAEVLRYE
jgi:lipoprotein-releasing system permease protein